VHVQGPGKQSGRTFVQPLGRNTRQVSRETSKKYGLRAETAQANYFLSAFFFFFFFLIAMVMILR